LFTGGVDCDDSLGLLASLPIPVVALDRRAAAELSAVVCDNYQGGILAVEHLFEQGRKRIAFIGGPARSSSAIDRRRGFLDTHSRYGVVVNGRLMITGNYSFDSGYRAAVALMESREPFDAIFAANDMMAIGAIEALTEQGINIPDDVAVVGYDDIRMAGWYKPALTTVRQPVYEMGMAAVAMLLDQISGVRASACEEKFKPELIVRNSSGGREGHDGVSSI